MPYPAAAVPPDMPVSALRAAAHSASSSGTDRQPPCSTGRSSASRKERSTGAAGAAAGPISPSSRTVSVTAGVTPPPVYGSDRRHQSRHHLVGPPGDPPQRLAHPQRHPPRGLAAQQLAQPVGVRGARRTQLAEHDRRVVDPVRLAELGQVQGERGLPVAGEPAVGAGQRPCGEGLTPGRGVDQAPQQVPVHDRGRLRADRGERLGRPHGRGAFREGAQLGDRGRGGRAPLRQDLGEGPRLVHRPRGPQPGPQRRQQHARVGGERAEGLAQAQLVRPPALGVDREAAEAEPLPGEAAGQRAAQRGSPSSPASGSYAPGPSLTPGPPPPAPPASRTAGRVPSPPRRAPPTGPRRGSRPGRGR
ncbi:hypothetical protein STANM337S_04907 [Streptomyces tanashiensis]